MSDPSTLSAKFDASQAGRDMDDFRKKVDALRSSISELDKVKGDGVQSQMKSVMAQLDGVASSTMKSMESLTRGFSGLAKDLAKMSKDAGKSIQSGLAAGMKEGEGEVKGLVRAQTAWLQAAFESELKKGVKFSARDIIDFKAWGINVGADIKASLSDGMLRAKSATKMSENDVRNLLGMPSRDEMKTVSAQIKAQMMDAVEVTKLRAKSATKMSEDDTRRLLGMPSRDEIKTFSAQLKAQMMEATDVSRLRAASAPKLNEDDARAMLGVPSRAEMAAFTTSIREKMMADRAKLEMGAAAQAKAATLNPSGSFSTLKSGALNLVRNADLDMNMPSKALFLEAQAAKDVDVAMRGLGKSKDQVRQESKRLSEQQRELNKVMNEGHSAARGLASGFGAMWLTWGSIVPLLAGAAISNSLVQSVKAGSEFEQVITTLGALSGSSAAELRLLSDEALRLGSTSQYGPIEVANALKTMALAGLDAKQQLEAITPVLNFATVAELSVEKAAESLTAVATAFGYTSTGFSAVSDIIAKSAAVSMSSVSDMTEAFRQASAVAQQYGVSVTDAATSLALLGQVGIRGSSAGTAMRNMYNELLGSSKQARKILKDYLGVDIIDEQGKKVKDLSVIMKDLSGALGKFDYKSQLEILQKLGNERSTKAISANLTALVTETKDAAGGVTTIFADLQRKLSEAPGFVAIAAAEMSLTSMNQMKSVGNAMQSSLIQAFQEVQPIIVETALEMRKVFNSDEFKEGLKNLVTLVAQLAGFLVKNIDVLAAVAAGFAIAGTAAAAARVAILGITTLAPVLGAAWAVISTGGVAALGALAVAAWPVALAAAAVGAAWWLFARDTEGATEKASKAVKTKVDATIVSLDDEIKRLERQIEVRRGGADQEQTEANERVTRLQSELVHVHTLERANLQLTRSRLMGQRAEIVGPDGKVSDLDKARVASVDQSLAANLTEIVNLVDRQTKAEETLLTKIMNVRSLAKKDAIEAAQAADAARTRPSGTEALGATDLGKAKLYNDGVLSVITDGLAKRESVIKNAYDNDKKLLDLDHQYKLVSEGTYLANSIALSDDYQRKMESARSEVGTTFDDQFAKNVLKATSVLAGKPEQLKSEIAKLVAEHIKFYDAQAAGRAKDVQNAEASQAAIIKGIQGQTAAVLKSTDEYIRKMDEQLATDKKVEDARRAMVGVSEEQVAAMEAAIRFEGQHATEINKLQVQYDLATLAASDFAKAARAAANGGELSEDSAAALQVIKDQESAFKAALERLKGRVATGAAGAASTAYEKAVNDKTDKLAKDITTKMTDAILDAGQDGGEGLRKYLEELLFRKPFRMLIEAFVEPIAGQIASTLIGGGSKGGGGGEGGLAGMVKSSVSGAIGGLTVGGSTLSSLASTFSASMQAGYAGMGSAAMASTGLTGASATAASAGASIGGFAASAKAAIAAIPGWGWAAAAFIAAAASVGSRVTKTGDLISGTISGTGASVQNVTTYDQDHHGALGIGSFTTKNREYSAADASVSAYLNAATISITKGVKDYASALGLLPTAIDGYSQAIEVSIGGLDAAGQKKAIDEAIGGFADAMVQKAYGSLLLALAKPEESATQTLVRLGQELTSVNSTFKLFGDSLLEVSMTGAGAATKIVDAFGGLEKFAQSMSSYYGDFFSESEKRANTSRGIADTLNGAGGNFNTAQISGMTREAYRAIVEETKRNLGADSPLYVALINASGAFASITPSLEDSAAAVARLAATNQSWQDKLDLMTGKETERSIALRDATDDSTRAIMRQVYAQEDLATAFGTAAEAAQRAAGDLMASMEDEFARSVGWKSVDIANGIDRGFAHVAELKQMFEEATSDGTKALQSQYFANGGTSYSADMTAGQAASNWTLMQSANQSLNADLKAWVDTRRMLNDTDTKQAQNFGMDDFRGGGTSDTSARDAANALASERKGLQDQLDELQLSAAEKATKAREALGEENRALYDQLEQVRANKTAAEEAARAVEKFNGAMKGLTDTNVDLQIQLLEAQGDTAGAKAATRNRDIAKLTEGFSATEAAKLVAQYDANAALSSQIDALTKSTAEAAQATESLKSAWASVTDSLLQQIDRIRGKMAADSFDSEAALRARFAIATAQARAGDLEAAKKVGSYGDSLIESVSADATSRLDRIRIQAMVADSLQTTAGIIGGAPQPTPALPQDVTPQSPQAVQNTARFEQAIANLAAQVTAINGRLADIQINALRTANAVNGKGEAAMEVEMG